MIANFCHYIQENQDVRSKLSEPLKSSEISSDWNSYRNTSDACILIKKNEEHCVFISPVHAELGLMYTDKIVTKIIEQ